MNLYNFVENLASNPFLSQGMVERYLKSCQEQQDMNTSEFIRNTIAYEEADNNYLACETKVVSWD